MKKILAGILASASLLTMTTSAFAATKEVKAAGDVEYDVAATTPKVVLNLIMPAKMSASLNPYKADIKLNADVVDEDGNVTTQATTTDAGIASLAYEITNMSLDYGIVIDATATTAVSTAKGETWAVKTTAPVDGTKGAQMALITADSVDDFKTLAESDMNDTTAGALLLDSAKTVKAKKFINMSASGTTTDADGNTVPAGVTSYIGFAGKLADSNAAKDVEWTEDDAINVALVLKVVAGPKGAVSNNPGPGGPTTTAATALNDVSITDVDSNGNGTMTFETATTTYSVTMTQNSTYTFDLTDIKDGFTATMRKATSNTTTSTVTNNGNGTWDVVPKQKTAQNPQDFEIVVTDGDDDTVTYTISVTL